MIDLIACKNFIRVSQRLGLIHTVRHKISAKRQEIPIVPLPFRRDSEEREFVIFNMHLEYGGGRENAFQERCALTRLP